MSLRPFILPADLDIMQELVMAGFQYPENPEWSVQDDERQGMLDSLQGIKKMWFLVRIMQLVSPSTRDIMRGFLYEEDGKPVGLINYMSPPNRKGEWMIANVTVLPQYRRRGIARKLVEATLNALRERKAKIALLGVIARNLPAVNLYKELGFDPYVNEAAYECKPGVKIAASSLPDGWRLAPLADKDWRVRYELALHTTPERVKQYEPVAEKNYKLPFLLRTIGRLIDSVSGSKSERLALYAPSGIVAGTANFSYRAKSGGLNHAGFTLNPDHAQVAAQFVQSVLFRIQQVSPDRRIEMSFTDWQPALTRAAEDLGCTKRVDELRMGLKFAENG